MCQNQGLTPFLFGFGTEAGPGGRGRPAKGKNFSAPSKPPWHGWNYRRLENKE
jgi:hypothetical protein